jgi:hypothetical protein
MSKKNSSDTIGNRNRGLPTCSAVPQLTALPRDYVFGGSEIITSCVVLYELAVPVLKQEAVNAITNRSKIEYLASYSRKLNVLRYFSR